MNVTVFNDLVQPMLPILPESPAIHHWRGVSWQGVLIRCDSPTVPRPLMFCTFRKGEAVNKTGEITTQCSYHWSSDDMNTLILISFKLRIVSYPCVWFIHVLL